MYVCDILFQGAADTATALKNAVLAFINDVLGAPTTKNALLEFVRDVKPKLEKGAEFAVTDYLNR